MIVAIGQRAETGFVASTLVPERTGFGGLPVDASNQRTTHPRLWAGGDVARGPRLLIEAVADGQRAAVTSSACSPVRPADRPSR